MLLKPWQVAVLHEKGGDPWTGPSQESKLLDFGAGLSVSLP